MLCTLSPRAPAQLWASLDQGVSACDRGTDLTLELLPKCHTLAPIQNALLAGFEERQDRHLCLFGCAQIACCGIRVGNNETHILFLPYTESEELFFIALKNLERNKIMHFIGLLLTSSATHVSFFSFHFLADHPLT